MPFYNMYCEMKHRASRHMTFSEFDKYDPLAEESPHCFCGRTLHVGIHQPALYGMMRVKDSDFADAEEATGEKVTSTRDIDRLEKAGVIRAVTNPSRYRKFKEKK